MSEKNQTNAQTKEQAAAQRAAAEITAVSGACGMPTGRAKNIIGQMDEAERNRLTAAVGAKVNSRSIVKRVVADSISRVEKDDAAKASTEESAEETTEESSDSE